MDPCKAPKYGSVTCETPNFGSDPCETTSSNLYACTGSELNVNPFNVRKRTYTHADRLDPGQPPSKSAASLRSNPCATRSIIQIPLQNQAEFQLVLKADI